MFARATRFSNSAQSLKLRPIFQPHSIFQIPLNLSNPAQSFKSRSIFQIPLNLSNPTQSFKPHSIFQPPLNLPTPPKTVIPSGAGRFFLPPSILRRSRSAKSRNLSSILAKPSHPLHNHHSLSPSPPPLAPSTSESPPTCVAAAPQTLDPSACNKSAPPDSPACKSCP